MWGTWIVLHIFDILLLTFFEVPTNSFVTIAGN